MMLYKLQIETINSKNYVTGYSTPVGVDVGIEMPEVLKDNKAMDPSSYFWRDKYGNPQWELKKDGTVVASGLSATIDQLKAEEEVKIQKLIQEELIAEKRKDPKWDLMLNAAVASKLIKEP